MTCYAALATDCSDEAQRTVYLDAVDKGVRACEPCIAYAKRMGMNPVDDRRSVPRIPEWKRRSLARDLTRQTGAA